MPLVAFVLAALTTTKQASAELHEAVQRLAEAWRAVGAYVVVDKSRFLADDRDQRHPISIVLPKLPGGDCTAFVVLGARGLGFRVRSLMEQSRRAEGRPGDPAEEPAPIASIAGAVAVEQCGQDPPPRRLIVSTSSGRGAIETVFARSAEPLPPLDVVLPERSGAPSTRPPERETMPLMPSAEKRAEIAEVRARRDGAIVTTRDSWKAGADGTGGAQATLGVGCHALRLFAPDPAAQPARRPRPDLDAEMRSAKDDRLLARDRTDAPDAELAACVGEPTQANIVFAGSPPAASVLVVHYGWPLPEHLPFVWGTDARARMARVLMNRHVVSLPHEPIVLVQGGSGVTPIPLTIEPDACYLALAAPIRDTSHPIGLRVAVGVHEAFDDRGVADDGAAVAFCAEGGMHALAQVEARGIPLLGWGLALYRLQSAVWEFPP